MSDELRYLQDEARAAELAARGPPATPDHRRSICRSIHRHRPAPAGTQRQSSHRNTVRVGQILATRAALLTTQMGSNDGRLPVLAGRCSAQALAAGLSAGLSGPSASSSRSAADRRLLSRLWL